MKVKIYGAGSIGNHLAQACRRVGWDVVIVDVDEQALERMRTDIYPTRYGAWDESIEQYVSGTEPKTGFDIVMIGTPPDVRLSIAQKILDEKPKLLHLEKPICKPDTEDLQALADLARGESIVSVGYDHAVAESVVFVDSLLEEGLIGEPVTLDVEFREHWSGIFAAHPWLKGPQDTYLGYWKRGGGASGEHSHALHLWLHFAERLNWSLPKKVNTMFDYQKEKGAEYDRIAYFLLETDKGMGRVVQDVVTLPVRKWARIQGVDGYIEWHCGGHPDGDLVRYGKGTEVTEKVFAKNRPDDFFTLVQHYDKVLRGEIQPEESPLRLETGEAVMKILQKAHQG